MRFATRYALLGGAVLCSGAAAAAERSLTITDFDRVRVEGSYVVEVTTGKGPSGRLSGSTEALDRIKVEVQDRTLHIRPDTSGWGGYPGNDYGPVRVRVTTPDLKSAVINGSGTVSIVRMRGSDLELALRGSGLIAVSAIEADRLNVGITGAGNVTLSGRVAQTVATIRGSGNLDAAGLASQDLRLTAQGSGDARASASRSATVTATGSGTVTIIGKPACAVTNNGAGTVNCGR